MLAARKLLRRRGREQSGRLLVEGRQAVAEAISAAVLQELFVTPSVQPAMTGLVQQAAAAGARVLEVTDAALVAVAETENPQGVVGVANWSQPGWPDAIGGNPTLAVLLHEVSDPGNAGAVIRVADAAGADLVGLSAGSVDPTNGKCVRASTGSVFHLPVVGFSDTAAAVGELQGSGVTVLAADISPAAEDLFELARLGSLAGPTAWLMGNEAHGLPAEILAKVDHVARIPILGRAESLNLATAAAICIYTSVREHSVRQR